MSRSQARQFSRLVAVLLLFGLVSLCLLPFLVLTTDGSVGLDRKLLTFWYLFCLVVAGLMAVWLMSRWINPVRNLTKAANDVASGVFFTEIPPEGSPDVQALARSIARMSVTLRGALLRAEAERDRQSAIISGLVDGIMIVDALGRISAVNPAAVSILDLGQDVVGKRLAGVVREHELIDVYQRSLENDPTVSHTVTVQRAAPRRYLRAVSTRIGTSPDVLILVQDLTSVRRLEATRRDFVANVSHELRTPIAAIKAMAETLEDGAIDDRPVAMDFLARIHREVDDMSHLVTELIQLSTIESGQAQLQLEAVEPSALLHSAVYRLSHLAERGGVTLGSEVDPDLPLVRADPGKIEQVLVNIIHNAIKFTPPGGRVDLSARRAAKGVEFLISDTGVGIAREDLDRLFERFYKADKSRKSGGTGLGLAIAKHLVQAHGGKIYATSPGLGGGSTFIFDLPLAQLSPVQ